MAGAQRFGVRRLVAQPAPHSAARPIAGGARCVSRSLACDDDKSPAPAGRDGDKSPHSKAGAWPSIFCFTILHSAFCLQASGQSYSIDWHTNDGGGGTSTGGVYAVSGTIGQPDAGTLSGGNYSVTGGFWSLLSVVQTPGAPTLTITMTTTNTALVSWPSPSAGFTLQQNTNSLASVNWSNVSGTIQDNGTIKSLLVNPPTGNRFYRLIKP